MSSAARSSVDLLREALAYVDAWLDYRLWKLRTPGAQVATFSARNGAFMTRR